MNRRTAYAFAFALFSLLLAASAFADSVTGAWGPSPALQLSEETPLRASKTAASVVAKFDAASEADLAALRQYNRAIGNGPAKVAVIHQLAQPVIASRSISTSANEPFHWRAAVQVASGNRLRLELTGVNVPAGTKFWVYGSTGPAYAFDSSLVYNGTIWTPSVDGDAITVEIETTAANSPFTISAVADVRPMNEVIPTDSSCIVDWKCYTGLDQVATAVAHMQYMSDGDGYICSGGLIIDAAQTFAPNFLTANHCISTASEAASLETFWDFRSTVCGGSASLSGKPRVNGSIILATSTASDFTLLRLTSNPPANGATRYFLGWTTEPPAAGTTLYRVSHPEGQPLRFSTTTVTAQGGTCSGWPRPDFIYQTHAIGTTAGGSSGSPVFNGNGQIVGQLSGACGPEPGNPCNSLNRTVDGALASSYSLLKPYINPDTQQCTACAANANTACMLNGRFKVTMTWRDPSANLQGNGRLINYSENRPVTDPANGEVSQVTFWSMYAGDPNSVEALVRMIRGGSSFWIFTTGFAAAEYTVTVQDTKNCTTWQRTSPFGSTSKIADYNGLPF